MSKAKMDSRPLKHPIAVVREIAVPAPIDLLVLVYRDTAGEATLWQTAKFRNAIQHERVKETSAKPKKTSAKPAKKATTGDPRKQGPKSRPTTEVVDAFVGKFGPEFLTKLSAIGTEWGFEARELLERTVTSVASGNSATVDVEIIPINDKFGSIYRRKLSTGPQSVFPEALVQDLCERKANGELHTGKALNELLAKLGIRGVSADNMFEHMTRYKGNLLKLANIVMPKRNEGVHVHSIPEPENGNDKIYLLDPYSAPILLLWQPWMVDAARQLTADDPSIKPAQLERILTARWRIPVSAQDIMRRIEKGQNLFSIQKISTTTVGDIWITERKEYDQKRIQRNVVPTLKIRKRLDDLYDERVKTVGEGIEVILDVVAAANSEWNLGAHNVFINDTFVIDQLRIQGRLSEDDAADLKLDRSLDREVRISLPTKPDPIVVERNRLEQIRRGLSLNISSPAYQTAINALAGLDEKQRQDMLEAAGERRPVHEAALKQRHQLANVRNRPDVTFSAGPGKTAWALLA